jgi:mannose-1-phosphate guanylyltransferase
MQIDHCLILAAGFGTRMGLIGQQLPKVLWPVFEKSLLELQVAYARSLGVKKIYINLHYMGEVIEEYCKNKSAFEDVTFLWEKPEILDIGGAIHQLASRADVKYKGKLLVLNADQFFYLSKDQIFKLIQNYQNPKCLLFNYWVNSDHGYNAIEVDEKRHMKSIIKNKDIPKGTRIETYTGISYIDLNQLAPVPGVSSFFESVCLYKKDSIPTVLLENVDYWDFGTLQRYWDTCFSILKTYRDFSNHPFLRFLVSNHALKTWKIDLNKLSYHSTTPSVINLGSEKLVDDLNECIVLNDLTQKIHKRDGKSVWWRGICEDLK